MNAPPKIFTPEYYERMRGLESGGWWNAGMRDAAARFLAQARLPERGLMLDVGCGSGQTMRWLLALLPKWNAVGIDVALDGLRAGPGQGVTALAAGSALDIPLPAGRVDLIVTLDVLQHLPLAGGDRKALAEMRRVLRPGGTLLVRTNAQAFPVTPDDPEHSFHKYRVPELEAKLQAAGFRVDRISRLNALLGLAEIPRELKADREQASSYHGILATPRGSDGVVGRMKRVWLGLEARAAAGGWQLPLGRTILALCTAQ